MLLSQHPLSLLAKKPETSGFYRLFCFEFFYHQNSFAEATNDGGLMNLCLGFKAGALNHPNRIPGASRESPQIGVLWRRPNGKHECLRTSLLHVTYLPPLFNVIGHPRRKYSIVVRIDTVQSPKKKKNWFEQLIKKKYN